MSVFYLHLSYFLFLARFSIFFFFTAWCDFNAFNGHEINAHMVDLVLSIETVFIIPVIYQWNKIAPRKNHVVVLYLWSNFCYITITVQLALPWIITFIFDLDSLLVFPVKSKLFSQLSELNNECPKYKLFLPIIVVTSGNLRLISQYRAQCETNWLGQKCLLFH